MRHVKAPLCLLGILFAASALAQAPALGFDVVNAQGVNQYFLHFFVNQTLGSVYEVVGDQNLIVTHLGVFDMNPDNEPHWDPENPPLSEPGLQHDHAVAIFSYPDMTRLAEVIIPAGTGTPIQDEGYRYLPLDEYVTLEPGHQYVLAAYWGAANIEDGGMDTFYLMGTGPADIPSTVTVHPDLEIVDGCFNPNAGDGSTVDPPFIFNMFWGLYAGGANFLVEETVAVESTTLSDVKNLFR